MNNYIRITAFLTAVLFPLLLDSASNVSPAAFFTSNEIKAAVNGGFLTSVTLNGRGEVSSSGVERTAPVRNSYITVSFFDFDMVAVEKGFFYTDGTPVNRLKIYRSLTDFTGLKGMVYYSRSEEGAVPLIHQSYRITSGDDYIKDGSGGKDAPERAAFRFAVKDNRLGLLTFRSEFFTDGENLVLANTSTGTSSKFGMDIFYPGDYRIYKILIYDSKLKGYFFYTVQLMKVRSDILSKMKLIKPESFGNRVRAEDIHFLKSIGIDRSRGLAAFR